MNKRQQRGAVLLMAILIVALITTVATLLLKEQSIWWRQLENQSNQAQAKWVSLAGIHWAQAILADDGRITQVDHLNETWARKLVNLPVDKGYLSGSIEDEQAKFNVNNLIDHGKANVVEVDKFKRLLQLLDLPLDLADSLLDWLDKDDSPSYPGGAEDLYYLGLTPAYRAANQPLFTIEELVWVKGFTPEVIKILQPFVTALPEPTSININTATGEVLAMAVDNLSLGEASALIINRENGYFKDIADFRRRLPATAKLAKMEDFSVATRFFKVTARVQFSRSSTRIQALLHRKDKNWPLIVWQKLL